MARQRCFDRMIMNTSNEHFYVVNFETVSARPMKDGHIRIRIFMLIWKRSYVAKGYLFKKWKLCVVRFLESLVTANQTLTEIIPGEEL